jgi:hypothetical protein
MNVVKSIAFFLMFWFIIVLAVFVITGAFSVDGQPLTAITAISDSMGVTVWDLGILVFIAGTFLDLIFLFVSIAKGW